MKQYNLFFILFLTSTLFSSTLPDSFDLRNVDGKNYINPVKDQGPYGTCYSFGATATAEGSYNYALDLYDENRASFSETFIIWSLGQHYEGFPTEERSTNGSEHTADHMKAMVEYGVISDEILPYNEEIMEAYIADQEIKKINYYWDESRVKFAGWHRLPINDIETMKKAIYTFGTLGASVYVDDTFVDYENGVFKNGNNEGYEIIEYRGLTNHFVSLVGWNEDDTWIMRNSWSDDWGDDGYINIDFFTHGSSIKGSSLHYLPWNEYGFENVSITNTQDITAVSEDLGYQVVSRGIYKWGNDNSFINNQANITAKVSEEDGFPFVHGIYLWAGEGSSIKNSGTITSKASSSTNYATSYGLLLQGESIENSGSINVEASTSEGKRATSYGVRHFSFDENSTLKNTGAINSTASSLNAWAYGVFGTDVQNIENYGNIATVGDGWSVGILSDGQRYGNSTVHNFGEINTTATTFAYGIHSFYANVKNEGNITASGDEAIGIFGQKLRSIDSNKIMYDNIPINLTNDGVIKTYSTERAFGMVGQDIDTILNSKEINVTSKAMSIGMMAQYTKEATNSGTITVHSENTYALGAEIIGSTFTNTGTITATSTNGEAYGLVLTAATAYNNGTINGNTILQDDAFLGRAATQSYLGGTGIFNGDVINESGVVNPGNSIGEMTINGDYIQESSSKLSIELNSTNSDKLIVNGDVHVKEGGLLELVPLEYLTTASFTSFIQSNDINGSFTLDAPAILGANLNQTNGNLGLHVNRQTYTSLGSTYSQKQIGQVLDTLKPIASSDIQTIFDTFEPLRLNDFQKALSALTPNLYSSTAYAMSETQTLLNTNLNQHMQDLKYLNDKKTHTWGTFLASTARVKSQNDILGFNQSTTGVMLGFDKKIQDNLTLGIATSFIDQDVNERGNGSKSDIDSYYAHLYAKYDLDNYFFTSTLTYGKIDTKSTRDIKSFQREAKSKYRSQAYGLSTQVGYNFSFDDITLTPTLELAYSSLHVNSFDESGAEDISLHVKDQKRNSLTSSIGFKLTHLQKQNNKYVKPFLRLIWTHEHLNDNEILTSNFIQSGVSFKTTPRENYDDKVIIGGGLEIVFTKELSLSLNANSIFTTNSNSEYEVGANLRFVF